MAIFEHVGSRQERCETVASVPEDVWTIEAMEDLLLGLWDHGYQVQEAATEKLLELACNPNIQPLTISPQDLALRHVTPGTYDQTFSLVKRMAAIGHDAKDICYAFFRKLKSGSKRKQREALALLESTVLYETAKRALGGD